MLVTQTFNFHNTEHLNILLFFINLKNKILAKTRMDTYLLSLKFRIIAYLHVTDFRNSIRHY